MAINEFSFCCNSNYEILFSVEEVTDVTDAKTDVNKVDVVSPLNLLDLIPVALTLILYSTSFYIYVYSCNFIVSTLLSSTL